MNNPLYKLEISPGESPLIQAAIAQGVFTDRGVSSKLNEWIGDKFMSGNSESKVLLLTEREVLEIKHAIFYANECKHGTTGHNQLVLIAKMAQHLGFMIRVNQYDTPESFDKPWTGVEIPEAVEVTR